MWLSCNSKLQTGGHGEGTAVCEKKNSDHNIVNGEEG